MTYVWPAALDVEVCVVVAVSVVDTGGTDVKSTTDTVVEDVGPLLPL